MENIVLYKLLEYSFTSQFFFLPKQRNSQANNSTIQTLDCMQNGTKIISFNQAFKKCFTAFNGKTIILS
jgi:hypothetical protein